MEEKASKAETTYPLSKQLRVSFSAYEDRLVMRSQGANDVAINMLLTRRMVMIVLHQLLARLPQLTGLDKTPAQYWQEVLQMAHQKAMKAKSEAQEASAARAAESPDVGPTDESSAPSLAPVIYLATELTVQLEAKELMLAFRGLPMPKAMVEPSKHEPVLALPLQVEHVHHLIELLISKANEAQWHLPLDLPWLENPEPQATSLGSSAIH